MWAQYKYGLFGIIMEDGFWDRVAATVKDHYLQALGIYFAFTLVGCMFLALPGVTFALTAVALFGPFWGMIYCVIAMTIGAVGSFLLGRYALKDFILRIARKNKTISRFLLDDNDKGYTFMLILTRLVPIVPYSLQNYAYGVTGIGFWKYTICTLVFSIPGVAVTTYGIQAVAKSDRQLLALGAVALIMAALGGVAFLVKKKYSS